MALPPVPHWPVCRYHRTGSLTDGKGRTPRGERCRAGVPHGHWKTTTFTGALRLTGMTAPMVLDGDMNGIAFWASVEQVLPLFRLDDCVNYFAAAGYDPD